MKKMTHWQRSINILKRAGRNDFRIIVFEIAKTNPAALVKAVRILQTRKRKKEKCQGNSRALKTLAVTG